MDEIPRGERPRWLDKRENVDKVYWTVWLICAVLAIADLIVHRHAATEWEATPLFYCLFGLLAGVVVILGAKELRRLIRRGEDYYDG